MNNLIIVILNLSILFLTFSYQSKYDPARFFSIIWTMQILLLYPLFYNLFSFTTYGLIYISVATLLFSCGSLAGELNNKIITPSPTSYIFNFKRSNTILKILFFLSLIYPINFIYERGFNISQLFSLDDLLQMNNSIAIERYTETNDVPLINQIFLTICYLTPLYGGFLFFLQTTLKGRIRCILSLFSLLLLTLTQNAKMGFMAGCFLFISGILTSCFVNKIALPHINLKLIIKSVIISLIFFSVLFLSMVFRTGHFDMDTIVQIEHKFIGYAFGHLPTFDIWFVSYTDMPEHIYSYGTKFFFGISNYLGIAERDQGLFQDFIFYGKNGFYGETNIYTAFRIIIEDFGIYPSLFFIFLLGYIGKFSMILIQNKKLFYIGQTILSAIFFFIFWSFATSAFAYTSYILMFVLVYVLLHLSYSKTSQTD